jgi:cytochrome c oxidase subunit 2
MRVTKKIALQSLLILGVAAIVTGTSQSVSYASGGFSPDVSSVNQNTHALWIWSWIAAGVVGVFTAILILWPVFFHRKKNEDFPRQTQYNVPVEILYTVIPFIIVAVLFFYTAKAETKITHIDKSPAAAHNIHVNAIQWSWQFTYNDAAAKPTITGTPEQPPVLVMPLGEKVHFTLDSNDVVHGFWIPEFMIQMQTLPGVTNNLEFTANKIGEFPGRCNILCGRAHSQMLFKVKVVSPADYLAYINSVKAA